MSARRLVKPTPFLNQVEARTMRCVAHKVSASGRREIGLFLVALLAYQLTRALAIGGPDLAHHNALEVIRLQTAIGVAQEGAVQAWALARGGLVPGLNAFYLFGHLPITAGFFYWLWTRRSHYYRPIRNVFLLANAIALAVFMVFPVAPPRMIPEAGLGDTLAQVSGVDLHAGMLSELFNPYAAVPSMHVGYALLVGVSLVVLAQSLWLRVIALAYPALVVFCVVATGNHFFFDAVAGAAVLAVSATAIRGVSTLRSRYLGAVVEPSRKSAPGKR